MADCAAPSGDLSSGAAESAGGKKRNTDDIDEGGAILVPADGRARRVLGDKNL